MKWYVNDRYYSNENLNMGMSGAMGQHVGNPWDLQHQFQEKPSASLQPAQTISGIKNELYINKETLKLVSFT